MVRRRFAELALGAFGSIGFVRVSGSAAQFELKTATDLPAEHFASVRLGQMWASIQRESGGRIQAQFFPNNILGGDASMLSQLRVGALQFLLISPANLGGVFPLSSISFLGFAFKDNEEGLRVMDGPLGAYIRADIASKGAYALRTHWDSGMAQIGARLQIRTPEDMRGFKIRVPEGKITVDLFRTLGANPVPLSASELYTALQTRIVDGESGPMVSIETNHWYETNKYMNITNHQWTGSWLLANGEYWKSLPTDLQELIERTHARYGMLERADAKRSNASVAQRLAAKGLVMNPVDQGPFRARLGPYYQTWATDFGSTAWGLLQSSLSHKLT